MKRTRIQRIPLYMRVAMLMAERGTCDRWQVGCVITREGRIIGTGYNGPAPKEPHCSPEHCDIKQSCKRGIHAETNAISFAAKYGISLLGTTIYITHNPCKSCAYLIFQAGINEVYYFHEFRETEGLDFLRSNRVKLFHVKSI